MALASAGVLFAPGYCFDAPEHFRLGFGAQSEGFAQALNIVSDDIARAAQAQCCCWSAALANRSRLIT